MKSGSSVSSNTSLCTLQAILCRNIFVISTIHLVLFEMRGMSRDQCNWTIATPVAVAIVDKKETYSTICQLGNLKSGNLKSGLRESKEYKRAQSCCQDPCFVDRRNVSYPFRGIILWRTTNEYKRAQSCCQDPCFVDRRNVFYPFRGIILWRTTNSKKMWAVNLFHGSVRADFTVIRLYYLHQSGVSILRKTDHSDWLENMSQLCHSSQAKASV
jgi:hypothetical protein